MNLTKELATELVKRKKMIDYLMLKTEVADWHGVADAAMDLREIDVKINLIKDLEHAQNQSSGH